MGILSNTVSFCQFKVLGPRPQGDLYEWASQCLQKNAFQSIEKGAEELSVGWVHVDDMGASDFIAPHTFWRDRYLVFSLRRDQRKVPTALVRGHLRLAEEKFLQDNAGLKRVPRQKREELRDAVHANLLARTLPVPATYDAVWDMERDIVSFAGLSGKAVELFENYFRTTFEGQRLVTVHPYDRAGQVIGEELQPALEKANAAGSTSVLDQIEDNRWVGEDFLLWLLYQTLNDSSEYRVSQTGPAGEAEGFVAYLNDRFVLIGGEEDGPQKVTIAGPQDSFGEIRAALSAGKRLSEAVIYLEKGENEWRTVLKSPTFHFGSFRSPKVTLERDELSDEASEKEAIFYERMHVLEEGLQLFDSLFAAFLQERLGAEWPQRDEEIRRWLAES
ncbi:MAG TPA: recombination-associated protein RdgC [Desulfuromonadales bacterium]|nr:recombination-associated protein RdgC [Desulfuromonadales bacterium]